MTLKVFSPDFLLNPTGNMAYEAEAPLSAWELTSTRLLRHPKTAIIIIIATAFFLLCTMHLSCVLRHSRRVYIVSPLQDCLQSRSPSLAADPIWGPSHQSSSPVFELDLTQVLFAPGAPYHSHLQRFLILDPSINFRGWSFAWNVSSSGPCGDNWCPVSSVSSMA